MTPQPDFALPAFVVCPACRQALSTDDRRAVCTACGVVYPRERRILNLLKGDPFDDVPDAERSASEELMDVQTTTNYTLPLLKGAPRRDALASLRVLSVGCGVGAGVDLINGSGVECYGIDCGSRVLDWQNRSSFDRLFIANAKDLPFADNSFDVAFSGCVLAHIGVEGDSRRTVPMYQTDRLRFCEEIVRVVRPGGWIVISGANRTCIADLFHRDHFYLPRFHLPTERFLLSFSDYRRFFIDQCGCQAIVALPSDGYWGFNRMTRSALGRLLARTINLHMKGVSAVAWLRTSPLNPWLVVRVLR